MGSRDLPVLCIKLSHWYHWRTRHPVNGPASAPLLHNRIVRTRAYNSGEVRLPIHESSTAGTSHLVPLFSSTFRPAAHLQRIRDAEFADHRALACELAPAPEAIAVSGCSVMSPGMLNQGLLRSDRNSEGRSPSGVAPAHLACHNIRQVSKSPCKLQKCTVRLESVQTGWQRTLS